MEIASNFTETARKKERGEREREIGDDPDTPLPFYPPPSPSCGESVLSEDWQSYLCKALQAQNLGPLCKKEQLGSVCVCMCVFGMND